MTFGAASPFGAVNRVAGLGVPHIGLHRSRFLGAAALIAVGFVACESPVEPLQPGQSVSIGPLYQDAISGGVDRSYSFQTAVNGEYVVYLKSLSGFVSLGVSDPSTHYTIASVASQPGAIALDANPTTNFVTRDGGGGLITIHVLNGDTALFQFKVARVNTAPEIAQSRFAFGDTVVGETIEPVVDADWFYARAEANESVTAIVEPLGGSPAGGLTLYVEDAATGQLLGLVPATPGDPLMATAPLPVSASQDYRFIVRSTSVGAYPRHQGPYRLWSYVIHPAPEHVAAAIPANVEIRDERIDYPNDVDAFTFQDTTGAEFNVFLESSRPFLVQVLSPTNSVLGARIDHDADTSLFHHGTGPFQITGPGTHTIRVATGELPWLVADTGSYRLILYRIDRRPERVPAGVQVGDTISGEAIDPAGDIDEFTGTATPGQSLVAAFRLSADPVPASDYLSFEVLDPATGALLSRVLSAAAGGFMQGGAFTVPASGTFQVRVGRFAGGEPTTAPYEFFFSSAPPVP